MSNLNSTEWNMLVTLIVALGGPYAAKYGISSDVLQNWLIGLGTFAVLTWGMICVFNKRLVAEKAIVVGTAPTVAAARAQSAPETAQSFASNPANRTRAFIFLALIIAAAFALLIPREVSAATMHVTHRAPLKLALNSIDTMRQGLVIPKTATGTTAAPTASSCPGDLFAKIKCGFVNAQKFTVTDLNNALADANAQTPPDTRHAQCWSALATVAQAANPDAILPESLGLAQLIQKAFDAKALLAQGSPWRDQLAQGCALTVLDIGTDLNSLLAKVGVTAIGSSIIPGL